MKRDPRNDPKAGDRLRLGKVKVLVLPCSVTGEVFFELRGKPCQIDRRGWIDWCSAMNAEVLHETDSI